MTSLVFLGDFLVLICLFEVCVRVRRQKYLMVIGFAYQCPPISDVKGVRLTGSLTKRFWVESCGVWSSGRRGQDSCAVCGFEDVGGRRRPDDSSNIKI